jgi:copper chaperone CopZ
MSNDQSTESRPTPSEEATYVVAGMSCEHCRLAVTEEVEALPQVDSVDVDLESKRVRVTGDGLDDATIRAAIEEAGYDAVRA